DALERELGQRRGHAADPLRDPDPRQRRGSHRGTVAAVRGYPRAACAGGSAMPHRPFAVGARRFAALGVVLVGLACARTAGLACARTTPPGDPFAGATWTDLGHAFDAGTVLRPTGTEGFVLETVFAGRTEGGYWYQANRFRSAEHGGTHLDAPVHFGEGRSTADAIPLERLAGPAVRIDVTAACAADPDHAVTIEELVAFQAAHGRSPDGAIVLIHTGRS